MLILITVVGVTLGVSAVCSLLEAALYSTRIVTLEAARAEGRHGKAAERMLKMKRDVATPTSAILILNTIANTAGATFAGMYAATVLGAPLVPLFSVILTVLILLFAEILPKTYGASHWKVLWPITTWPLAFLVRALSPLIWFTRKLSSIVAGSGSGPVVTEDEIRATVRLGGKDGALSSSKLQILESVFYLDDTTCAQVMVPRNEVKFVDLEMPPESLSSLWSGSRHTRYPVCRGSLDDVVGLLHTKDMVGRENLSAAEIEKLVRPVTQVPQTMSITRALRGMQSSRRQMVLVVNEFGSMTGIVTLKDILEELVGPLDDEHEIDDTPELVRNSEGYKLRGNVSLARIERELGLDLYEANILTLAGLLMHKVGRPTKKGDKIELAGAVAEVTDTPSDTAILVQLSMQHRGAEESDEADEDADED